MSREALVDLFGVVAQETLDYAREGFAALGAVKVSWVQATAEGQMAELTVGRCSQMVRTELRDAQDPGSDYSAAAAAKLARRARVELGVDTADVVRKGEVSYRGDAAFVLPGRDGEKTVLIVTFSGHPDAEVDCRIALDGLLALWLKLSAPGLLN